MKTAKERLAGAMSRKLLVAIGAVVGIPLADLPNESWIVAIAYIVSQAVIDVVEVACKNWQVNKGEENAS